MSVKFSPVNGVCGSFGDCGVRNYRVSSSPWVRLAFRGQILCLKGLLFGFVFCFATFRMFCGIHVLSVCIINGRYIAFSAMLLSSDEALIIWSCGSQILGSHGHFILLWRTPKSCCWVVSIDIYCI